MKSSAPLSVSVNTKYLPSILRRPPTKKVEGVIISRQQSFGLDSIPLDKPNH